MSQNTDRCRFGSYLDFIFNYKVFGAELVKKCRVAVPA